LIVLKWIELIRIIIIYPEINFQLFLNILQ